MAKLSLSLPGDEMDMPPGEGMDEKAEPGVHGKCLKMALDKGDNEAIEEAIRAIVGS